MDIQTFKDSLLKNKIPQGSIIFKIVDIDLIPTQYYRYIANKSNLDIKVLQDEQEVLSIDTSSMFFQIDDPTLYLYKCEEIKFTVPQVNNLIIITKKLSAEQNVLTVDVPKINSLWLKDYMYSNLKMNTQNIDKLFNLCSDPFLQFIEVDRYKLFNAYEQNEIYNQCIEQGQYIDNIQNKVFEISNAILRNDLAWISEYYNLIYSQIPVMQIVAILYKNLKNIILVWCQRNPTEDNTGLSSKQIWAIKNQKLYYNHEQLIKCFNFICDIDKKIKCGIISTDYLLDYILTELCFQKQTDKEVVN